MTTVNGVQLLRIASNCWTECSTGSVEPSSYATTFLRQYCCCEFPSFDIEVVASNYPHTRWGTDNWWRTRLFMNNSVSNGTPCNVTEFSGRLGLMYCLHLHILHPEDGGSRFLQGRQISTRLQASHPGRLMSSPCSEIYVFHWNVYFPGMEMGVLDLEKFKWLHPAHVESSSVDHAAGN